MAAPPLRRHHERVNHQRVRNYENVEFTFGVGGRVLICRVSFARSSRQSVRSRNTFLRKQSMCLCWMSIVLLRLGSVRTHQLEVLPRRDLKLGRWGVQRLGDSSLEDHITPWRSWLEGHAKIAPRVCIWESNLRTKLRNATSELVVKIKHLNCHHNLGHAPRNRTSISHLRIASGNFFHEIRARRRRRVVVSTRSHSSPLKFDYSSHSTQANKKKQS